MHEYNYINLLCLFMIRNLDFVWLPHVFSMQLCLVYIYIYSQTCINSHLDIAWPCVMWPLSGPTDEIPYILVLNLIYIAWPCPTQSAATYFQSQTRNICPITVTIECARLQFSRRVQIHATLSPISRAFSKHLWSRTTANVR